MLETKGHKYRALKDSVCVILLGGDVDFEKRTYNINLWFEPLMGSNINFDTGLSMLEKFMGMSGKDWRLNREGWG